MAICSISVSHDFVWGLHRDSQRTRSWPVLKRLPWRLLAAHWYMPASFSITSRKFNTLFWMTIRSRSSRSKDPGVISSVLRYQVYLTTGLPIALHIQRSGPPRSTWESFRGTVKIGEAANKNTKRSH